jgi:hypothetical protein
MRKMSETMKMAITTCLIIALAVVAVAAYLSWQGEIKWKIKPTSKEFEVYYNDTLQGPSMQLDLGDIDAGEHPFDFVIKNVGNVQITVKVSDATSVGCTASWSSDGTYVIPVGENVTATLTLNITADGSYTWKFESI